MNNLKKYYDYGYGDAGGNIENKEVRNREIADKLQQAISTFKQHEYLYPKMNTSDVIRLLEHLLSLTTTNHSPKNK